jgi:ATP-dependent helicase/DNAse subunit B
MRKSETQRSDDSDIDDFLKKNFEQNIWTHKKKNGTWRIKTNEELDHLIKHNNIMR